MNSYKHLFSEGRIGRLTLKNRYFMSPAETLYASASGEVTPQIIEFYRRRAMGGVGLIVLHSVQGNSHVDPLDPYAGSLRIDNNAYIPMLSDLVEAVHNEGSKIACLVSIGGGAKGAGEEYSDGVAKDKRRVAPSYIPRSKNQPECREITENEIREIVENYGRCAWRAKAAGFDAFYIHALGSYLLAEFLSPLFNHRTDNYGGNAENRWRILFELIESCQRQAGKDFPLIVRLSVDEMHPDGRTLAESLEFLPRLEKMGVAALDVTAGLMDREHRQLPPIYVKPGINKAYLSEVRKVVNLPLINSGHLKDPRIAEEFLSEGIVDFVGISRGLIADPDLPLKVQNGEEEKVRKCLSCNYCIGHRIMQRLPIRCAFNPYAGHETTDSEFIEKTPNPKRYVVVGAGPAGLEMSRMLALKGHTVDLYEAGPKLCAGQIEIASIPPCKGSLHNISDYYCEVFKGLPNLTVHLNSLFTENNVNDAHCVFIATGARPLIPNIPGVSGENVVTAQEILLGKKIAGKKVVILGGGQIGSETAHYLLEKDHEVTIVDQLPEIAMQEEPLTRAALLNILEDLKLKVHVNSKVEEIGKNSVLLSDTTNGNRFSLQFDTAVVAFGTRSDDSLANTLRMHGVKVCVIGDANKVGNIATAISNAHYMAQKF